MLEAAAGGLDVAVHAIGDAANRAALNAFEATRERWERRLVRPRIEHVQCLDDADLPRFAELGVIASVQPSHATSDRDVADRLWGDRAAARLPHPRPARSGAHLVFGSDAPVEPIDPLAGIHAAVHRRRTAASRGTANSNPGRRRGARIHRSRRLRGRDERRRGLLLPGYTADLVVLDTDIIAEPERIAEARVEATMLAGRWVHNRPPW